MEFERKKEKSKGEKDELRRRESKHRSPHGRGKLQAGKKFRQPTCDPREQAFVRIVQSRESRGHDCKFANVERFSFYKALAYMKSKTLT